MIMKLQNIFGKTIKENYNTLVEKYSLQEWWELIVDHIFILKIIQYEQEMIKCGVLVQGIIPS